MRRTSARHAWAKGMLLAAVGSTCAGGAGPVDLDEDGVPDDEEASLIERFAPIIVAHDMVADHAVDAGIPVDITWFLQHVRVVENNDEFATLLTRPTPAELLALVASHPDPGSLRMPFVTQDVDGDGDSDDDDDAKWGNSPIDPTTWQEAAEEGHGVYARVFLPWPATYPELVSVQYFMLLTWNDTEGPGAPTPGAHDGDWICLDYCVDRAADGGPRVIHAIYHNHGRQIYLARESMTFSGHRAFAFLERGTNEPWPNAGPAELLGWPTTRGFAKNARFTVPIGQVYREHEGGGWVYDTAVSYPDEPIPNVGESRNWDGAIEVLSLTDDLEGEVFHRYPGMWGWLYEEGPGVSGDPPRSPPHQQGPSDYPSKMWARRPNRSGEGSGGLWIADDAYAGTPPAKWGTDPYVNDVHDMGLWVRGPGTLPTRLRFPADLPEVVRKQFVPTAFVSPSATPPYLGLAVNPYLTVSDAVEFVLEHGAIVLAPGSYDETVTIDRPLTITATGVATIGR